MARSFGQLLMRELHAAELGRLPVYMGGVLNEDIEGSEIPVDVREDLRGLGITPMAAVEDLVAALTGARPAPRRERGAAGRLRQHLH